MGIIRKNPLIWALNWFYYTKSVFSQAMIWLVAYLQDIFDSNLLKVGIRKNQAYHLA